MISIVNRRYNTPKYPYDIMIDRSTIFGNPFPMDPSKDRTEERNRVCDLYEKYFYNELLTDTLASAEIAKLVLIYKQYGYLNLFCWCHPFRCHGETIKRYIEEICKKEQ